MYRGIRKTFTGTPSGRLQLLGLCRFSHLGEGAFRQMADATMAERREALFEPGRLDLRMIWFRHVFLPGIAAQTNKDFRMIVLTSDQLPEPWRGALLEMVRPVAEIEVVFRPPGPHRDVCREVMQGREEAGVDLVGQFRLDDDDAVAVDFIERLRADQALLAALMQKHRPMALDYGKGLVVRDCTDHLQVTGRITQAWAPGLTMFLGARAKRSLLDFQHQKVPSRMAFVSLLDQVMYVRGAHEFNDAGVPEVAGDFALPDTGPKALLMERFRIDFGALEQALTAYHRARKG